MALACGVTTPQVAGIQPEPSVRGLRLTRNRGDPCSVAATVLDSLSVCESTVGTGQEIHE